MAMPEGMEIGIFLYGSLEGGVGEGPCRPAGTKSKCPLNSGHFRRVDIKDCIDEHRRIFSLTQVKCVISLICIKRIR